MAIPMIAVSSDWHLRPNTWASRPEIKGDAFRSANFIVNWCIGEDLPLLVLGDILDRRDPDSLTVATMTDIAERAESGGINISYLVGQHEKSYSHRTWMSCHAHPVHFHKRTIKLQGFKFYGLDFLNSEELKVELENIPKDTDVLCAHQVWAERLSQGMKARSADASFSEVPYVKMIVSGDFHAHIQTKHKNKDGNTITALSPGSTYLKAIDEDPLKYFYVLYNDLSYESVQIPTRPLFRARVVTDDSFENLLKNITSKDAHDPEDPDKPVWDIEYSEDIPAASSRLISACKNRSHLISKPINGKCNEDVKKETATPISDPSQLINYLEDCCEADSAEYKTAKRLLETNNITEELDQLVKEAIESADKNIWDTN